MYSKSNSIHCRLGFCICVCVFSSILISIRSVFVFMFRSLCLFLFFFFYGFIHSHSSFYELPLYSLQIFRLNDRQYDSCYFFIGMFLFACCSVVRFDRLGSVCCMRKSSSLTKSRIMCVCKFVCCTFLNRYLSVYSRFFRYSFFCFCKEEKTAIVFVVELVLYGSIPYRCN